MSNEMYRRGQWDALGAFFSTKTATTPTPHTPAYNPAQFEPHFQTGGLGKHLGYGALAGGLANAGLAAVRGDDTGDVVASGLKGALGGGVIGGGVGIYRQLNDPARIAQALHQMKHAPEYANIPPDQMDRIVAVYRKRFERRPGFDALHPVVRKEFELRQG